MSPSRFVRTTFLGVLALQLSCHVFGAEAAPVDGPDPREIPLPSIATSLPALPGVSDLPTRPELPDPLTFESGARIGSAAEWPARRAEIRRVLEYYAIGRTPPPPGNVEARELRSEAVLGGEVKYRLIHLTFGPNSSLSLHVGLFTPSAGGPFPVVIAPVGTPPGAPSLPRLPMGQGQGKGVNALLEIGPAVIEATPGSPPAPADEIAVRHADLFRRGFAYAIFNHHDCGEDTTLRLSDGGWAFRSTRFFPAYPDYDWGLLGAWAWGVSRIIDYLVTDPAIAPEKIVVTGVSRTGKSALVAGAFDDRIALTAPVVTGGGGVGAYRFSGIGRGGKEGLGEMMRKYPNWFSPHLRPFWGHTDKLRPALVYRPHRAASLPRAGRHNRRRLPYRRGQTKLSRRKAGLRRPRRAGSSRRQLRRPRTRLHFG